MPVCVYYGCTTGSKKKRDYKGYLGAYPFFQAIKNYLAQTNSLRQQENKKYKF